ncbi:MAG: lipoyl(octanoyl) transferase LipB [candidate division WOR-3 bacterium]
MQKTLNFLDWGICDYGWALQAQRTIWQKRIEDKMPDTLILTEHFPVFTIGKHGKMTNLLVSEKELKSRGIKLYKIERGGDITFHGPGQLVGYAIFKLIPPFFSIKKFINTIEQIIIDTLNFFNITATTKESLVGVWVGEKKIASIGIAISRHVSLHGFALNVSTDLSYFNLINPCGMTNINMTSMQDILNCQIEMEEVKSVIKIQFNKMLETLKDN